jgi:chemotaxis methyl-accepting protein methylase
MIDSAPGLPPELRCEFLHLIEQRFGLRGSDYVAHRLDAAVADLLQRTSCADARALFDRLRAGERSADLEALVEQLTVGETYFFRDSALITALRTVALPDILERRLTDRSLRIWSAGCSTGEEPYTLAILLQQQIARLDDWDALLVGTDVNRASLRLAREAIYPAWSFRAVSEEFRKRYFRATPRPNTWQLTDEIRRLVRFGWTNLADEALVPPSANFDLILCRNVTIYFDAATTQRLYHTLINALAPGGWLVLGPSDPMPDHARRLERVEAAETVLWRRADTPASRPRESRRPRSTPARHLPDSGSMLSVPAARADQMSRLGVAEVAPRGEDDDSLRAGLLALESGSYASAIQWLRRSTFRNPNAPLGQFALARAYLGVGDTMRAQAALLHADRLLAGLGEDGLAPGSETLSVATLREMVQAHLAGPPGA